MSDWITIAALALGCLVLLHIRRRPSGNRSSYPLPPGPPGLPWVGNVTGINTDAPWETYFEWARIYGDIIHSRLLGKDVIIINSEKIAKDLLEDRSKNYSNRPHLIANKLTGLNFATGLLAYDNKWRLHRRFFHQTFRLGMTNRFLLLQHHKACHLVRQLLEDPDGLKDHIFEHTASMTLNSAYGYDPASRKDELLDILASALKIFVPALRPDIAVLLNAFPLVSYLPSWFPGMSFKEEFKAARVLSKQYLERPFQFALQKQSSVTPSMVHDALHGMVKKGIVPEASWMEALKGAAGTTFIASDTSNSVLLTFFLMMTLNPAVQEVAQAQVDAIVGRARLPTISDRPLLPWVDAILWETIRYSPVLPLAIAHTVVEDDIYNGFHIPKGAVILTNLWSMSRNESKYPNPHSFVPGRFLNEDGSLKPKDIENVAFGFGRRKCPGRHFADESVWSVVAKVLAVFKISKAVDENGVEIPVQVRYSSGLGVHPLPFKCRIVPRLPGFDAHKLEELVAAASTV